jgi:non-heme chloroperoxidase
MPLVALFSRTIVKIPNRGHALTIDHGWREVDQTALDFVKRSA